MRPFTIYLLHLLKKVTAEAIIPYKGIDCLINKQKEVITLTTRNPAFQGIIPQNG